MKVDVLLRDLEVALHWSAEARGGAYEVDALLGYLAGAPTYSLMAELALNRERAGLGALHARFVDVPASPPALVAWLDDLRAAIDQA
jgi:hypothetical protein